MNGNREPSKHIVRVLNLKNMAKEAVAFLIGKGYDLNRCRLEPEWQHYGIVTDVNGKHYLINWEGCGSGIPLEREKDSINFCKNEYDEEGRMVTIGMSPIVAESFDIVDAMAIPVEKEVRLDEFVRKAGPRLDRNCATWDRFLTIGIEPTY